jgi:hypothetical protein
MIYIQHSYIRAIQTSTSKSPFETFFEYFPPSPLYVVYGQQRSMQEYTTKEALKDEKMVDGIRKIHLQVQET